MSITYTVEGDITAVDTRTLIVTQGSVTAPSSVTPAKATKIDKIVVACSPEALADGSASFFLRLGGNAVKNGEQTIVVAAAGRIAPQAGSDAAPAMVDAYVIDDVDLEVSPSDTITVAAEMAGQDLGTAHIGVTLIYA